MYLFRNKELNTYATPCDTYVAKAGFEILFSVG
jgi:hypothetical protein